MSPRLILPAALLALLGGAAPAAAAGWGPVASFDRPSKACRVNCIVEPAPRVAVNRAGRAAVAWAVPAGPKRQSDDIRVSIAPARGRFGAPATLGRGLRPTVAVTPQGTTVVVFPDRGTLRFVRRAAGASSWGRTHVLVTKSSKNGDDFPRAAAQPDGSVLVVYENAYRTPAGKYVTRLFAVTIGRDGRVGRPVRLGTQSSTEHDPFRAIPDGEAAVCCVAGPGGASSAALWVPGRGWAMIPTQLAATVSVETVGPGRSQVALGALDVHRRGDAGALGVPGVARLEFAGIAGPLRPVTVAQPTRGLQPVVAIDGDGRDVLVYQEKTGPGSFRRDAPVYAVAARPAAAGWGPAQRLDAGQALQPMLRTYGAGALAVWETAGARWRAAVERDGVFRAAAAPPGSVSYAGTDFSYNRDLAAAGRYAAMTWIDSTFAVRASVGTP